METVSKIESPVAPCVSPLWLVRTKTLINMEKIPFISCHSIVLCLVRTQCKTVKAIMLMFSEKIGFLAVNVIF